MLRGSCHVCGPTNVVSVICTADCPWGPSLAAADAEIGGPEVVIDVSSETRVAATYTDVDGWSPLGELALIYAEVPFGV